MNAAETRREHHCTNDRDDGGEPATTLYTTLQRLERDGLVASGDLVDGPQKDFRITPKGEAELRAWIEAPSDSSAPPRDELVIKVLIGLSLSGIDMRRPLQVHRRHLVERMQRYTHVKAAAAEDEVVLPLVAALRAVSPRWDGAVAGRGRRTAGATRRAAV